jgi:hypothetical protein
MRPPALQDAILAHLLEAGEARSSRDLASRFLRISTGDEATCHRLLAPFLADVPGVVHSGSAGWSYRPPARGRTGAPPPGVTLKQDRKPHAVPAAGLRDFVALAADGAGPGGSGAVRTVSLLPVIAGEECQEEHLPSWAPDEDGWGPEAGPGEPPEGLDDTPSPRPPRGASGLAPEDLEALVEAVGDLPIVCHRAGREVEPLRRACAAAGLAFHPSVISAAKLGHLLHGLKANHAAVDLAAALGLEARGPDDCRGRVRVVAAAYMKMIATLEERGIDSIETLLEFQDMPSAPLDLSRYAFSEEDLRALPAGPGVYCFLDRGGDVLYIGKAKNLRSRVSSYFAPSARGTAKGQAILDRVHAFRIEEVASELEAALLEAALISEQRPTLNRQFEVHERPAPYGPRLNLAVVLRDPQGGQGGPATCTIHFLASGRYLGRIPAVPASGETGRSGVIWSAVADHMRTGYFPPRPAEVVERATAGSEVDWQLVGTFLRKHGDEVCVLDLDECASPVEALRRISVLVDAACASPGRVLAR